MRVLLAVALLAGVQAHSVQAQRGSRSPFPHERHERLFPLCESCHAGIVTGDARAVMPAEASCRECHNGTDVRVVDWQRTERPTGLLRFSHPVHARQVDSTGRACATCHGTPESSRMQVHHAEPPACLGCHTHRASEHLGEDNRCAVCHVPLVAATGLTASRVEGLPRPPSHARTDFVSAHDPQGGISSASCAVCHARESCARCHVNATSQPLIASLARDARVASLVRGRAPVYPVPADHRRDDFIASHGESARANVARCGTCHARPSCTTCHIGPLKGPLARLPVAEPGGARGVQLQLIPTQRRRPTAVSTAPQDTASPKAVRVHDPLFRTNHKASASTASATCSGCHEQRFCSDCHGGEGSRRFHAANFVQRHAADSYGRETQCASCHNAELFCRSCHRSSGLASKGRLDAAFHDAQPQWLLNHGRAARQGLQSCATCHAQRDCLTCHSTIGWGVNPHGPGFQPERAASRNATQCLLCHLQVPRR